MIWFCVLLGIVLGFAFESFPLGLLFTILGGAFGLIYNSQRNKVLLLATALKQRVDVLEAQNKDLSGRVKALGEGLNAATLIRNQAAASATRIDQRSGPAVPVTETLHDIVPDSMPAAVSEKSLAPPMALDALPEVATPAQAAPSLLSIPAETTQHATPAASKAAAVLPVQSSSSVPPVAKAGAPAVAPKPVPKPVPKPKQPSALELKIKQLIFGGNQLVKIGVLILFLGLAFLLRYASEYIVVPVELRYAGVAAVGVALLIVGWRLRHKKDNYGLILQGAGVAVMYLTPLAAMRISELLPPQFGFAVLVAVAAFAAILAILQDSLAMAIAGTLGGFAAPLLVSTGHDAHLALFLFLTVLNLGIAAIAWFKAWRILNLIGFGSTFLLVAGWAEKFYAPPLFAEVEPFLLLFFALYVLITFLFARRVLAQSGADDIAEFAGQIRQSAAQLNYVDGTLAFAVPFVSFAMQYLLVRSFSYGAAFSALGFGLFYAAVALVLFRHAARRLLLLTETLLALAVIFGSLAIPLGLDQTWTSAAWAVEAGGMYWIALKQERLHGRIFALLILIAASFTSIISMRAGDESTALTGSTLGCLLLAASAAWICLLMRRAEAGLIKQDEMQLRPAVMVLGAIFLACAPYTLLPTQWASTALALVGVAVLYFALRWSEKLLQTLGWLYQALAGALFIATLHAAAGVALASGASGNSLLGNIGNLMLVSLIGASMLASVWFAVRQHGIDAAADGTKTAQSPLKFGPVATIALLAGIVFVNIAPLFVLSLGYAALVWTVAGLATLWWALRVQHVGAVLLGLLLQLAAGIAHLSVHFLVPVYVPYDLATYKPFMHSGFWGPVLISLASLACARLLLRMNSQAAASTSMRKANTLLGWISLAWSVVWWAYGWVAEITRVVAPEMVTTCLLALVIITAAAWSALAKRRGWRETGLLTLLYVPSLLLIASDAALSGTTHPLAHWGMLAWPLAFAAHGFLLKWQTNWVDAKAPATQATHVVGAWLFVVLAAWELRWHFANLGDADSAWPLLGWMIAPVAYLLLLTVKRVQQAWPVRDQFNAYLHISAIPVIVYLFAWVWVSNVLSAGDAAPLPYVPILNPLEIAHLAVLLCAFLWWLPQRMHPGARPASVLFIAVAMASGLAILTGIVARTSHHWGGVAWNADALWASTAYQTALSIAWSITAITTMIIGNRGKHRWVWVAGATLMGVVVLKLFLVELAAHGSLARIVSFIVVGFLLLVVGYFAPLPPRRQSETIAEQRTNNDKA